MVPRLTSKPNHNMQKQLENSFTVQGPTTISEEDALTCTYGVEHILGSCSFLQQYTCIRNKIQVWLEEIVILSESTITQPHEALAYSQVESSL